jgi:hypothetical protein
MNSKFILFIFAIFLFNGCYKEPDNFDDITSLLNNKQWRLAYISEDRGVGPIKYNDNYNTTTLFFSSDNSSLIKLNGKEYYGNWTLDPVKSSFHLVIDIPEVQYISKSWVITDIYRWGYDQTRVVLKNYDFETGMSLEMGLY